MTANRVRIIQQNKESVCDVLVVGSGAAGLSAAITARLAGLDVLVVEKAAQFGGTTARSGGWVWIPMSPQAQAAGVADSAEEALRYLGHEAGSKLNRPLAEAFLANGPRMLRLFAEKTSVRFEVSTEYPDYYPDVPGGKMGGRSLSPLPIDARELGDRLPDLAPPLRELSLAGIVIGAGTEMKHFFNVRRSWKSALFVVRKLLAHAWDVLRFGRGMTLVNGNALAGRLGKTLFDLGVPLWLECPATQLIDSEGRVAGAWLMKSGRPVRVLARLGVVLACGGFPHDVARRVTRYPHSAGEGRHFSLAPPGNMGDGLRMAESVGGRAADSFRDSAAWTPVSRVRWPDGAEGIYPHFVDRAKPGIIAVTGAGVRFVNESNSYHDFIRAFAALHAPDAEPRMFFICDRRAIRSYGMGIVKPFPFPMGFWLRSGYLMCAPTLAALARRAGIDPQGLERNVAQFNAGAERGEDPDFGRGRTAYNHFQGDPEHRPNPCLAPLSQPPFYAVRIWPGDLGTFAGLLTDHNAQVLGAEDRPVPGLYAVGNDMASVMGGSYLGAGGMLGPALVFGYIAAMHLVGESAPGDEAEAPMSGRGAQGKPAYAASSVL